MNIESGPETKRRVARGFAGWPGDIPFVVAHDLQMIPYLAAVLMLCAVVPRRLWPGVCRRIARLVTRPPPKDGSVTTAMANVPRERRDLETLRRHNAARILNQFYFLSHYVPWRAPPHVHLDGAPLIDKALEQGNGAIVWMQPTVFGDFGTKFAFHNAGYLAHHLSHITHGVSYSMLGAKLLNPIWTHVERAYLAERIVMAPGASLSPLQSLARHLRRNRIVSIAAGGQAQVIRTLKFRDEILSLSAGPAILAWNRKAVLMPVFTVAEIGAGLVAHIDDMPHAGQFENRDDFIDAALEAYIALLEAYAARVPAQLKLDNLRLVGA